MPPKTPKLLHDIHDAASFILQVTHDKTVDDYEHDRLLHDGVERNFEIIGEAMGRLVRVDAERAARLGPYRQIIAFRNILIHGYDLIDRNQVWNVIREGLPDLADRIRQELDRIES